MSRTFVNSEPHSTSTALASLCAPRTGCEPPASPKFERAPNFLLVPPRAKLIARQHLIRPVQHQIRAADARPREQWALDHGCNSTTSTIKTLQAWTPRARANRSRKDVGGWFGFGLLLLPLRSRHDNGRARRPRPRSDVTGEERSGRRGCSRPLSFGVFPQIWWIPPASCSTCEAVSDFDFYRSWDRWRCWGRRQMDGRGDLRQSRGLLGLRRPSFGQRRF